MAELIDLYTLRLRIHCQYPLKTIILKLMASTIGQFLHRRLARVTTLTVYLQELCWSSSWLKPSCQYLLLLPRMRISKIRAKWVVERI